jgi:hypothetical protein
MKGKMSENVINNNQSIFTKKKNKNKNFKNKVLIETIIDLPLETS